VVIAGEGGRYRSLDGTVQADGALAFDIGPNGQRADYHVDGQLYINGVQLTISPASEFGLPGHKQITDIRWSPNGRYVAFIMAGSNPAEYDYGVWVIDTATNTSNQIMHNDWEYREATRIAWAPNSTAVLIRINRNVHTFLPVDWDLNTPYREQPYSHASWAPNSESIIVSGRRTDGQPVLGRVLLDWEQTFVPIAFAGSDITFAYSATELANGQIAFLGSVAPNGPYRLYLLWPGSPARAISPEAAFGEIIYWEWNDARTSLLVVVDNGRERRVWLFGTNGTAPRDITPAQGVTGEVRWR
jgi:hypothetical protein